MKHLYVLWALLLTSVFSLVKAQQPVSGIAIRMLRQRGEICFRFTVHDKSRLQKLEHILSIDKIRHDTVFAYANAKGFSRFVKTGIPYVVLTPPSQRLSRDRLQPRHFKESQTWDSYPSYDQYVTMMYAFQKNHPELCKIISIGKTTKGRELLFAHIGHLNNTADTLPRCMYTSTMHGDETTGYILMLRLIDYLLKHYGIDKKVTNLMDSTDIWINPLANPDGTYAAGNNSVYGATRFNANHIDLNRNYPDPKAGQHPDGNAWQPETKAFMHFADSMHFVLSCNMHTGSEVANYPWDTWPRRTADDAWWQKVCRQYVDTVHAYARVGYMTDLQNGITDGYDWYSITGGRQDYMNYFQHDREFTLELSHNKMPDPDSLPKYWEYNYRSLLDYIRQAWYGFTGTVTDSLTGQPLKAEIFTVNHDKDRSQVYSDPATGRFFRPLYPGTYDFRFLAPGYRTKTLSNVAITSQKPYNVFIRLVPEKTGIGNLPARKAAVYPNPATCRIYCSAFSDNSRAFVVDLSGRVLLQQKVNRNGSLDISSLHSGIYLLKIISGNKTMTLKFRKQ